MVKETENKMTKNIKIALLSLVVFLVGLYTWRLVAPIELESLVNDYFKDYSYLEDSTFQVYDSYEWENGLLVAVEGEEMVGVAYLEKKFGAYKVKDHALCNKKDTIKGYSIDGRQYQYRVLRAKSFLGDKDVLMAYVNDPEIKWFKVNDKSLDLSFELSNGRRVMFGQVEWDVTDIKTSSNNIFVEWNDDTLQDIIKYDTQNLVFKSEQPLSIAVVGPIGFNVDESINIDKVTLEEIDNYDAGAYDALFVNSHIEYGAVEALVERKWTVYVINPASNIKPKAPNLLYEDVIVLMKGPGRSGRTSKYESYDLQTSYFMAYNYIFERLSKRKL
jgi:hypothetical protein